MKFILSFLLLTNALAAMSQQKEYSNYSQKEFDSDTCCWRQLSVKDSFTIAAQLIEAYLHRSDYIVNRQSLNWHAGQMFALAGMNKQAIHRFKKTYNIFTKWFGGKDEKAWYFYAKGTVAFLRKKQSSLNRIIRKWQRRMEKNKNYESIVSLQTNFTKTYREALR